MSPRRLLSQPHGPSEWRAAARQLRPVFIVGAPRSGTSILYRSLQTHPSFHLPVGLQLVETHAIEQLPRTLGVDGHSEHPSLANYMADADHWRAFLEDIEPLRRRRLAARRLRRPVTSRAVWIPGGEHHVLRRYFLGAHVSRQAPRLVEKTPSHVPWIGLLRHAFPEARFVYVTRHPIDVLGSYWERYAAEPETAGWANVDIETFCARWARGVRIATTAAAGLPGRVLIVKYESFTTDVEPTVRRLLEHVGEPFDDACLLREDADARSAVVSDADLFRPVRAVAKRWEDRVSIDVGTAVEDRLSGDMATAGYSRYTPETN